MDGEILLEIKLNKKDNFILKNSIRVDVFRMFISNIEQENVHYFLFLRNKQERRKR